MTKREFIQRVGKQAFRTFTREFPNRAFRGGAAAIDYVVNSNATIRDTLDRFTVDGKIGAITSGMDREASAAAITRAANTLRR